MDTWDLSEVSIFFLLQRDVASTDMLGLIQNYPWDVHSPSHMQPRGHRLYI